MAMTGYAHDLSVSASHYCEHGHEPSRRAAKDRPDPADNFNGGLTSQKHVEKTRSVSPVNHNWLLLKDFLV
jgi:hypothetical protein